jgi:hypothetical protein
MRLCEVEPFINFFFLANDVRGFEASFFEEPFEFGFGKGLFIVIDSCKGLPTFLYQLDDSPAGGAGGFLINGDSSHDVPSLV